ncbi:MAG TPA: MATE family efflux transporter, partial [Lachnoclostridium phytofermentans]|nr:MATE family efflux transporter [Lachnoclostridium phytofermentans]
MAGILRGAGDTLYCATFDVLTSWVLKLGGGLLATLVLLLPPVWVYFILSSDECVKALITV